MAVIAPYSVTAVRKLPGYLDVETIPAPKFGLFQIVRMHYPGDDESPAYDELVQIVGMAWKPKCWLIDAWIYHVRLLDNPPSWSLPVGYQEDCPESELYLVDLGASTSMVET